MEAMKEDLVYTMDQLQSVGSDMLRCTAEICEKEHIRYCMMFGSLIGAVRHHGPIPWDYDIDIAVAEADMPRFIEVMERDLPERFWVDFRSPLDSPKCLPRIGLRGYDTRNLHIDVYRMIGFPDAQEQWKKLVKRGRLLLEMRLVKAVDLRYYSGKKKKAIQRLRPLLFAMSTESIVKRFDALCTRYPYETANKVGLNACRFDKYIYDKHIFEDTILVDYQDFQVRIPREYDYVLGTMYRNYRQFPPQETIDKAMRGTHVVSALK